MRHWHNLFPGEIMDFHYESVLEKQEIETKKLLDFCGLEWEEQCLKFYETKRSINTASSEQVRQPIYKGAMYAWKNYESHIGELIETLSPLLNDLNDDAKPQSLRK
jgi:predicted Zn-dependent protease with MMP-like domain